MIRRAIGYKKAGGAILPSLYTGLLANYKLDETSGTTAIDETGNFPGIINGTPTLGEPGKLGTGYDFKYVLANYVDLNTKNLIGGRSAFSIAIWSKATNGTDGSMYGAWSGARICAFGGNGIQFQRFINQIYIGGALKGGSFPFTVEQWGDPLTQFQFMICTYDGANLRTFLNNNESSVSFPVTGIVSAGNADTQKERIGSTGFAPSGRLISSVQIWDRALNSDERASMWGNGNGIIL